VGHDQGDRRTERELSTGICTCDGAPRRDLRRPRKGRCYAQNSLELKDVEFFVFGLQFSTYLVSKYIPLRICATMNFSSRFSSPLHTSRISKVSQSLCGSSRKFELAPVRLPTWWMLSKLGVYQSGRRRTLQVMTSTNNAFP